MFGFARIFSLRQIEKTPAFPQHDAPVNGFEFKRYIFNLKVHVEPAYKAFRKQVAR